MKRIVAKVTMRWPAAGKTNRADRNRPARPRAVFGLSDFVASARGRKPGAFAIQQRRPSWQVCETNRTSWETKRSEEEGTSNSCVLLANTKHITC
eukprot:1245902-Alexandrium_andersonii.AAC.1